MDNVIFDAQNPRTVVSASTVIACRPGVSAGCASPPHAVCVTAGVVWYGQRERHLGIYRNVRVLIDFMFFPAGNALKKGGREILPQSILHTLPGVLWCRTDLSPPQPKVKIIFPSSKIYNHTARFTVPRRLRLGKPSSASIRQVVRLSACTLRPSHNSLLLPTNDVVT